MLCMLYMLHIYIYIYIYIYIGNREIEYVPRLHTTDFTDAAFQMCTKITILFYLLDVV